MRQIKAITNTLRRRNTFCKRKKILIKKAMELSQLCSLDVYLCILDKEKRKPKMVQYVSSKPFLAELTRTFKDDNGALQQLVHKTFTNNDYNKLFSNEDDDGEADGDLGSDAAFDTSPEVSPTLPTGSR